MQELIVVGMRFQEPAYKNSKINRGSELMLCLEPDNIVNDKAVAVYTHNVGSHPVKIGYIRDADLMKVRRAEFSFKNFGRSTHPMVFSVDRVCPNYLRITATGTSFGDQWNYNPDLRTNRDKHPYSESCWTDVCAVGNPTNTYQGVLQNGDEFTATICNPLTEVQSLKTKVIYDNKTGPIQYPFDEPKIKSKEEKKMNITSMRDSFFKEVKNVSLDMQSGKLGVVTKDGIITATDDGVSVNPITEMGFTIPAFAMRVPVEQLVKGDIIITASEPVFFLEGSKVGYMTITTSGVIQETGSVANMFFGKNTVMAVKNMFGSADTAGGMNPMLMMAMMGDSKDGGSGFDFKKMMMMQMMMGQGGSNQMNPMMMAMMFADKL